MAIFILLVGAALSISEQELSVGYVRADLSQERTVCSASSRAVDSVGFSFGAAQSVGYSFKSSAVAFVPNTFLYTLTLQLTDSQEVRLEYYSGIFLFATGSPHYAISENYYELVYPEGDGTRPAPLSDGATADTSFCSLVEQVTGGGNYFYAAVFTLPGLSNSSLSVNGEELWRLYAVSLVGASAGVEGFSRQGSVSFAGNGERVYSFANVVSLNVSVEQASSVYAPSIFFAPQASYVFASPSDLQVVLGNVTVGGSYTSGGG